MSNPTGPQPGQGHPWGPQTGPYVDQQGPAGTAPGQQPGSWGQPGGQGQPGGPASQGAPGQQGQPGGPQQGGGPGQQGSHPQSGGGYGPPLGGPSQFGDGPGGTATQAPTTATAAAPVSGSSGMSTADVVRLALHIAALLLVVLGISLDLDDRGGALWSDTWTWAGFATLMALLQGAAMLPRTTLSGAGWTLGAVGAGGLLLFWTLLMLPMISTNMAFLVTLGTACATAAVLLSPDRRL